MAYLPPDEERRRQLAAADPTASAPTSSAPADAGGGAGPAGTAAAPQQPDTGSGWTNLQTYLAQAGDAPQQMGAGLVDQAYKGADAATPPPTFGLEQPVAAYTPDQVNAAQSVLDNSKSLDTQGGRAALSAERHSGQNYTPGMAGLDAYLSDGYDYAGAHSQRDPALQDVAGYSFTPPAETPPSFIGVPWTQPAQPPGASYNTPHGVVDTPDGKSPYAPAAAPAPQADAGGPGWRWDWHTQQYVPDTNPNATPGKTKPWGDYGGI